MMSSGIRRLHSSLLLHATVPCWSQQRAKADGATTGQPWLAMRGVRFQADFQLPWSAYNVCQVSAEYMKWSKHSS